MRQRGYHSIAGPSVKQMVALLKTVSGRGWPLGRGCAGSARRKLSSLLRAFSGQSAGIDIDIIPARYADPAYSMPLV
jgi:hypothetical protein